MEHPTVIPAWYKPFVAAYHESPGWTSENTCPEAVFPIAREISREQNILKAGIRMLSRDPWGGAIERMVTVVALTLLWGQGRVMSN